MADLSILASYAHPDDEQGVSGTLRQYVEQGIRTGLVCATRGEVGEIADPSLATPETLGEVREQELRSAAEIIGIHDLYFLDYRDSGMVGTPENQDPRAFINANEDEAVGQLVRIIREFKPTVIVTFDETGGYGHPDHLAIHRWTTKAFRMAGDASCYPEAGPAFAPRRLYYASIGRSSIRKMAEYLREQNIHSVFANLDPEKLGLPDELITNKINVAQYVDLKRRSLLQHKTQMNPNGPFSRMPEETWNTMRGTEFFMLAEGEPLPSSEQFDDLFAGLR
jgi:LmbE family N-acetylglucosaminyl deacetylase